MLVVMTSLMGYAIASGGGFQWLAALILGLGGFLVTASANAINQVLEKEFDALMERTRQRPLAAGRMRSSEAVLFAGIACLLGVSALAFFNPLTALLGMISLIMYAFVYTPLKRYSTLSVAVGGIPGALPVLIGYTAYSGEISVLALVLFSIQFLWQFPHFWSIGYLAFDDYHKAGYKLLPERNGKIDPKVGLYSSLYALLIVPFTCILLWYSTIHPVAIGFGIILSIAYGGACMEMYRKQDKKSALTVMFCSFAYLPLVFTGFLLAL